MWIWLPEVLTLDSEQLSIPYNAKAEGDVNEELVLMEHFTATMKSKICEQHNLR